MESGTALLKLDLVHGSWTYLMTNDVWQLVLMRLEVSGLSQDVQEVHDIGSLCLLPHTNSKHLHRVSTSPRTLSYVLTLRALPIRTCVELGRRMAFGSYRVRCSRLVTLVLTVTLHILTVSNCTKSRPAGTA